MASKRRKKTRRGITGTIQAWQDDPLGLPVIARPVPAVGKGTLKFRIKGPAVAPGSYPPGTGNFRYWTAAEALRRGGDFWGPILGVKRWQPASVLPVGLDEGDDLNAYYDRSELAFFHHAIGSKTLYSGESPDVVCHEMGHACLDAHQPALWDAPFIEAGSFHESFGDMSAILSALQLPGVRAAALGPLKNNKPSVLSRLAEQLGWGLRQVDPTLVNRDCLRNACNAFAYVDPNTLPNRAPASKLCAEVHSFSRVFTGAFYEILSRMLKIQSSHPGDADLVKVARDVAQLLVDATASAPVQPDYFAQVATHMIDADTTRFGGRYRTALTTTFVRRRIVPAAVVQPLVRFKGTLGKGAFGMVAAPRPRTRAPEQHAVELRAREFGLGAGTLVVNAPLDATPFLMASASLMHQHSDRPARVQRATERFVKMLFAHRRVDTGAGARRAARSGGIDLTRRQTHVILRTGKRLRLVRRKFDCGCDV